MLVRPGFLLLTLLLSAEAACPRAQTAPEGDIAPASVSFPAATAKAGEELVLPMQLSLPGGAGLGALTLQLEVPPLLTLLRIELAYPAEQAGATLSTEALESGTRVRVAVPEGARQGLRAGPIAFLSLRIAEDATDGKLLLTASRIELVDLNSQPVQAGQRAEGEIQVVPKGLEPLFACYFYMH